MGGRVDLVVEMGGRVDLVVEVGGRVKLVVEMGGFGWLRWVEKWVWVVEVGG